ncbi:MULTISPECIES: DNA recombination protein RmuC [Bifidobacterium]|uniref:DNA recombination protein RmuC n=1 Tax=Bifidobacterium apousia TaxID=2750996 RepID=A0A556R5F0_9BIFI|nr:MULTISPECIES: DNA recombination protein RmuC [Bifidobacterium]MBI0071422.1 DNA recombination protein RmuC [Bifidobacterium sp. W8112]MBI0124416.1 DNA recombination protein RmuC [Bifidobacterium apousia]MBI0137255.1 DNA recombination protein RmuC [Bifidobacterium sp. W8120]TSJ84097.1 DNA recombination protein RmuC [Bifidobacterium apousia]
MFDSTSSVVMVVFLLLIGMVLGGLAGYALGRTQGRRAVGMGSDSQVDELRSQLDQAQDRLHGSEAALVEARTKVDGLNRELSFVKSQLAQAQQAEQIRIEQERRRAQAQEEEKRRRQAQNLEEESKVLSALAPVQKNLDALQHKVAQIEEGRKQEMGSLGQQLKSLGEQQGRLDKETSSLASALRNNKVRGAWGEAQLRNIVESAGLLEHVDFDTQVVVTASDGRVLRPDMVVHLPGGKTIPIDAKAPYSDYQRACEIPDTASDDELHRRDELLKAHARALREHVKALADKEYWNAFETAPDFVVAFIPNDSLLQAALEVDPTLMDDAFAQKVALTSPVTLWAVLKSVAYAWQQQNLSEDARTLFTLTHELYDRFVVLGDRANKLGRSITATVTAYNKFASSLESRVLVTARKLQQMDPAKVIDSVDMIDSDKGNIRELTAPEVLSDQGQ